MRCNVDYQKFVVGSEKEVFASATQKKCFSVLKPWRQRQHYVRNTDMFLAEDGDERSNPASQSRELATCCQKTILPSGKQTVDGYHFRVQEANNILIDVQNALQSTFNCSAKSNGTQSFLSQNAILCTCSTDPLGLVMSHNLRPRMRFRSGGKKLAPELPFPFFWLPAGSPAVQLRPRMSDFEWQLEHERCVARIN